MKITRQQAIDYLNGLGDPIDWDNSSNNATNEQAWTLEEIREEVLSGDEYSSESLWQDLLNHYGAEDIKPNDKNK